MNRRLLRFSVAGVLLAGLCPILTSAGPTDLPQASSVQSEPETGDLLGPIFESESAGISLRIPGGCRRLPSSNAGDDIAQFGDPKRKWQIKLTRIVRTQPTDLRSGVDPLGQPVPGLLESTVANLKRDLSGSVILRQDLTNIADTGIGSNNQKDNVDNVGMIAVRYTVGGVTYLSQQAIIQSSSRLFYLISLTSPAAAANADRAPEPGDRAAVEAFRQMLDSVRLLDTASIRREQDERLLRTQVRLLQLKSKSLLRSALIDQQWLRIQRNGRDVGYSYVTEQTAAGVPRPLKPQELRAGKGDRDLVQPGDGILIGIRSRIMNPPEIRDNDQASTGPVQVDNATWLFVKPDQSLEDWSRITVVKDGSMDKSGKPIERESIEFGSSSVQVKTEIDKSRLPGTKDDPNQPPVSIREHRNLNVTIVGETGAVTPVQQEVPKFYLPQALSHLLPRLLPLRPTADGAPRTYLFAVYVPETRQVMSRYVDVGAEGDFTLSGRKIHAIPIADRLGWHGSVTTHYISPDGAYLGSENKDSHTVVLPTDARTLLSIWKGANLTQPEGTERNARPSARHDGSSSGN